MRTRGIRTLLAAGATAALALTAFSPAPSGVAELGDAEFERLGGVRLPADAEFERELDHGAPLPEDSIGIGPGSTLVVTVEYPDGGFTGLCTAAHVYTDGAAAYLAAAGHCFIDEGFSATHGEGADWQTEYVTSVQVCVADCLGGATGLVTAASGAYPGTLVEIGDLAYARQQTPDGDAVGHDFGIVEIPPELYDQVRTSMPVWHGPTSDALDEQVDAGEPIVHYGNGVGVGEVFPTKGRGGPGVGNDGNAWFADSAAAPGDSGSAVNIAQVGPDGVVTGEFAAGVLTHLVVSSTGGVIAGTMTSRAVEMALQDAGIDLSLVIDAATLGEESGGGNGGSGGDTSNRGEERRRGGSDHPGQGGGR